MRHLDKLFFKIPYGVILHRMDYSTCIICSETINSPLHSRYGVTSHVRKNHPKISLEKFFKLSGGKSKQCPCGETTPFKGLFDGYSEFCSLGCYNTHVKKGSQYKKTEHLNITEMYENGMSVNEIAEIVGLNKKTIRVRLKCEIRNLSESTSERLKVRFYEYCEKNRGVILDAHNKYIELGLNEKKVSELIGCNNKTVKKIFNYFNLRIKTKEELLKIKNNAIASISSKRKIVSDWEKLYKEHLDGSPIYAIAEKAGISPSVVGRRFSDLGLSAKYFYRSNGELLLSEFLKSCGIEHITTDRNILKNTGFGELDIYIPSINTAIEFNGVYYHSSKFKESNYHQNKTDTCLNLNIPLIHIWEGCDFLKVFARLRNKLNIEQTKINARDCEISIDNPQIKNFFEANHLDDNVSHKTSVSLLLKGKIVAALSIRDNKGTCEIARYANLLDTNVVGGFSRLLKHSRKLAKALNYTTMMTYADIDWTPDYRQSVYFKNGFEYIGKTQPKLFYTGKNKLVSRYKFQKHKLKDKYPEYNGESVNTFLASKKIFAVYRTGNHKFQLDL